MNPQRGRRQHGAGGRRKEEAGVRTSNQRAQSEHLQKAFNSMFKCSLMMLKLMLCLFQENKSYGVKTICIHSLMSRHCTSLRHVWHKSHKSIAKTPAHSVTCIIGCSLTHLPVTLTSVSFTYMSYQLEEVSLT